MLKKAYLEITNVCNLNCSFCRGNAREKGFISVESFRTAAEQLRRHTDYLYLHLMGEPLLHPQLEELLAVCADLRFHTVITTNGVLLPERSAVLLASPALYKVSVSLHSFEGNGGGDGEALEAYLRGVCGFAEKAAANGVIVSLRLWNGGGEAGLNPAILRYLKGLFGEEPAPHRTGLTLAKRIYLEYGEQFDWPDPGAAERNVRFCMGLRDHIGVLWNGTVVPCCLDADGNLALGNLFAQDLEEILASPKAKAIYDGFSRGRAVGGLCRRCGYAERFSK